MADRQSSGTARKRLLAAPAAAASPPWAVAAQRPAPRAARPRRAMPGAPPSARQPAADQRKFRNAIRSFARRFRPPASASFKAPEDCCPTCPETGCDECPEIACDEGTHAETAPGDCCPSCLPDPPDACTQGQKSYADFLAQLLEKYSATGCKNSAQCGLVKEDNACAFACNIPLPTQTVHSFVDNLASAAASDCSSCAAPAPARCESQVAACVNGKCAAAEVERP